MRRLLLLLLWAPLAWAGPRVSAVPASSFAGSRDPIRLRVDSDQRVHAFASSGELRDAGVANGQHTFEWIPPEAKTPATGVVVFVGEDPFDPTVVTIPLLGRTELEIDTEPGADVRVELGGRSFGPRTANARGKVTVPIEVPPGTAQVQVIAETKGTSTAQPLPLQLPFDPAIAVGFGSSQVARGDQAVLIVAQAGRLTADQLEVKTSFGSATAEKSAPGRLFFRVPAPPEAELLTATLLWKGREAGPWMASTRVVAAAEDPYAAAEQAAGPVRFLADAGVGYFVSGNGSGPRLRLGIGAELSLLQHRLKVAIEPGLRVAGFTPDPAMLGGSRAALYLFPLEATARVRAVRLHRLAVNALAGAAVLPFAQVVSSDAEATFSESGIGWEAFAGAEATWALPQLELYLGARFVYGGAGTDRIPVPLTRGEGMFGARFRVP